VATPADPLLSVLARRAQDTVVGGVLVDLAADGALDAGAADRIGLGYLALPAHGAHVDPEGIARALEGRPLAAVSVGDLLGRVGDLEVFLQELHGLCAPAGAPLLVAQPNIARLDVAAKLLVGRWDETDPGPRGSPHVRHFSHRSLGATMTAHGWQEIDAEDEVPGVAPGAVRERTSVDVPTLVPTTAVGALVRMLRERAGAAAHAQRLVRLYVAADVSGASPAPGPPPFLSVLVRTQGRRSATLEEALLCLAAQTCDDFEVLVVVHDGDSGASRAVRDLVAQFHDSFSSRTRVVEVSGGERSRPLNEGAAVARGEYLAMLDDDDLVLANWVEVFRDAARASPGRVVRTAVATQRVASKPAERPGQVGYEVVDRPRLVFALDFDHVDHIPDNRTPNNGYAFPRSVVTEMGLRWDESLPVLEDWDHLLWAASICGVEGVPVVTGLLRWWDQGEDSKRVHAPEEWEAARRRVIDAHDAAPLLLDRGTFRALRTRLIDGEVAAERASRLEDETRRLAAELDSVHVRLRAAHADLSGAKEALATATAQLAEIRASRSWRVTAPMRVLGHVLRGVRRARAGPSARGTRP